MSSDSDDRSLNEEELAVREVDDALLDSIWNVKWTGDFACFRLIEEDFALPGIVVEDVGPVRVPLSIDDANALIRCSRKAPFGKGTETLIDEAVRRTWEIDAGKVTFLNDDWKHCIDKTVKRVAQDLGVAGGAENVRAEFYKMLLYEKGAMFKMHRDTEKVPGMFATLVICLPSIHAGGAVLLRHGDQTRKFETASSSAFKTSCIAWYADVLHEIEPVQEGFRWVLTYNLIKETRNGIPSASGQDAEIEKLSRVLTQWRELEAPPQFRCYALDHKYTNAALRLAELKGVDYCRARYVARSSERHGEFAVLLANMERCVTLQEDCDDESQINLLHIVDLEGFDLTAVHLRIPREDILQDPYGSRDPDVQRGGEHMGNQHAEVERFYKDSVMILVPKCGLINFVLPVNASRRTIGYYFNKLSKNITKDPENQYPRKLLTRACEACLARGYQNHQTRDSFLGPIATVAVFMRHSDLYHRAASLMKYSFDQESISSLGQQICTQNPFVPKEDIAKILTKSASLHMVYANLLAFRKGFLQGHEHRNDRLEAQHLQRWLDSLLFNSLNEISNINAQDADTLMQIVHDHAEDEFGKCVLFQGIKIVATRFIEDPDLVNELMIALLKQLESPSNSKNLLEHLANMALEPSVAGFRLTAYVSPIQHINSRDYDRALRRDDKEEGQTPLKFRLALALYKLVCFKSQQNASLLLEKILEQTPLKNKDYQGELLILLRGMMDILDASTSQAQNFIQSLMVAYITHSVGREPIKPENWTRPDEVYNCSNHCATQQKLTLFLQDPATETTELSTSSARCSCMYQLDYGGGDACYWDIRKDGETMTITKTGRAFEPKHRQWEQKCSNRRREISLLPQSKLKRFLADRYEEIVELHIMKKGYGLPDSRSTVESQKPNEGKFQNSNEESALPPKRARSPSRYSLRSSGKP